jgi:Glycosyl transferase family 2
VKLVETLVVRDEADIVGAQIRHHLSLGVDFIVATDHGSVDGTTDILESYVGDGYLHRIAVEGDMHDGLWRTQMARLASTEFGADWIINTDADEFWMPRGATLKEFLADIPEPFGIVFALSRHFAPRPEDGHLFVDRMTVRVSPPVAINDPTSPYRPHLKVAHRGDPNITVRHGAHGASSPLWEPLHHWHACDVLHFPYRGRSQWEHKGVRRARGDSQLGQYVSALLASEAGRAEERYASLVVDDDELARGLGEESLALDTRLLDELGLAFEQPEYASARLDEDVIAESAAVRDADIVRLQRHTDELMSRVAAVNNAGIHLPAVLAAAAMTLILLFVVLPEVFADHPFDPRPSRVLHVMLPVVGK